MTYRLKNFSNKTTLALVEAIASIPVGITTLDLTVNGLHSRTGTELAQVFAVIPASIVTLNLSYNGLNRKTGAGFFARIRGYQYAAQAEIKYYQLHMIDPIVTNNELSISEPLNDPRQLLVLSLTLQYFGNSVDKQVSISLSSISGPH